jgi:hypothetical protein
MVLSNLTYAIAASIPLAGDITSNTMKSAYSKALEQTGVSILRKWGIAKSTLDKSNILDPSPSSINKTIAAIEKQNLDGAEFYADIAHEEDKVKTILISNVLTTIFVVVVLIGTNNTFYAILVIIGHVMSNLAGMSRDYALVVSSILINSPSTLFMNLIAKLSHLTCVKQGSIFSVVVALATTCVTLLVGC